MRYSGNAVKETAESDKISLSEDENTEPATKYLSQAQNNKKKKLCSANFFEDEELVVKEEKNAGKKGA